jgi:hypothetical protein
MSQIDRWVLRSTLEWLDNHPEHRDRLALRRSTSAARR